MNVNICRNFVHSSFYFTPFQLIVYPDFTMLHQAMWWESMKKKLWTEV